VDAERTRWEDRNWMHGGAWAWSMENKCGEEVYEVV
jgi:hypothetical protein